MFRMTYAQEIFLEDFLLIGFTNIEYRRKINKMKGKVKFFNREKEFGFIIGDDGKDYFVHKSGLQDDLTIDKDDLVEFSVEQGDRGLKAVKVSKA